MRCPAAQTLAALKELRLTRRAPAQGVFVTTDADWTELLEGMAFATVEVWRRDAEQLDWSAVAGLRVTAIVSWTDQALRQVLFDAIRAAEPAELDWKAIEPKTGRFLGQVLWANGEPQLLENPMLLRQHFELKRRPRSKHHGLRGELENQINDAVFTWDFWKESSLVEIKERLEKYWWTYGQV